MLALIAVSVLTITSEPIREAATPSRIQDHDVDHPTAVISVGEIVVPDMSGDEDYGLDPVPWARNPIWEELGGLYTYGPDLRGAVESTMDLLESSASVVADLVA